MLALPRANKLYSLDTDASSHQVGVALFQEQDDGSRKPIGFWSRTLNAAERNYSATERECLALVYGVTVCAPYLIGEKFTVFTDHKPLKWLATATNETGRLMRWRLRLSSFDFDVFYKKGVDNAVADAVSRVTTNGHTVKNPHLEIPCYFTLESVDSQECDSDCESDESTEVIEPVGYYD